MTLISIPFLDVDGEPTPAETALLSDPTGTFGIRRVLDSAVVVPDATALSVVGETYQYNFAGAEEGVEYEAYFELTYDGDTYRTQYFFGEAEGPIRQLSFVAINLGEFAEFTDPVPKLASPTGGYGVKDLVVGTTLVVANAEMATADDVLWTYSLEVPEESTRVRFYVKATIDDIEYCVPSVMSRVNSVMLAIGRYTNSYMIGQKFGHDNLYLWAGAPAYSAEESDEPVDLAQKISDFILQVEDRLDEELLGAYIAEEFTAPIPRIIKDIATTLAAVAIYEARGVDDTTEGEVGGHRLSAAKKQALKDIRKIKLGLLPLTTLGYGPVVGAHDPAEND